MAMPLLHDPASEAQAHASLIVALDAGDLAGDELHRAQALAGRCSGCAALLADLAVIRGAVAALPVPARRRDFRLTDADAARLRPTPWRRLLGWLAAPGSSVRPLATGLAALGVVGILVTAGLPGIGTGATSLSAVGSAADRRAPEAAAPTGDRNGAFGPQAVPSTVVPAPAYAGPTAAPATSQPAAVDSLSGRAGGTGAGGAGAVAASPAASPAASADQNAVAGPAATPATTASEGKSAAPEAVGATGGIPVPLATSALLLIVGLGLFLARAVARRRLA